jgi:glycine cleavage system H protein
MYTIPGDRRYTTEHTWVRTLPNRFVELGMTDYGQGTLGTLVSVELPAVGRRIDLGDYYLVLESTKAAFELSCPLSGQVAEANLKLNSTPTHVNQDPYGKGWLVRLRLFEAPDALELSALLDSLAYAALVHQAGARARNRSQRV